MEPVDADMTTTTSTSTSAAASANDNSSVIVKEMSADEKQEKQLEVAKYPKAVAFIISNEFCERFNFYGMRAILVLYLTHKLGYNEEASTVLFHIFTMLVYVFPLFGAVIADGCLGKYRTILYLSAVYSIGALIVSIGSVPLPGMPSEQVTIVGLVLIAIGTGGIKPCVSAFGGDQFQLPEQGHQLAKFFSLFYFAINAGSMISTTLTPILRADVHCFGENDCYPLAFGVPAMLMIISMVIFAAGKTRYKLRPPSGNMIFGVSQCVMKAFVGWRKHRKDKPLKHFLDYAAPAVGQQLVDETKCLAKILLLYMPFPIFWALSDQQGSRWTFQATHMEGMVWGYQIKPDQMQVINPLLILAFIPLFDYVIYPLLARIGIRRPLQKLSSGLFLAAIGFFISAAVQMRLENMESTAYPSSTQVAHLRLYNGMPCQYVFNYDSDSTELHFRNETIEPLGMWSNLDLYVPKPLEVALKALSQTNKCPNIAGKIRLEPGKSISYLLTNNTLIEFPDGLNNAQLISRAPQMRVMVPMSDGPILLRMGANLKISIENQNLSALHELSFGAGELVINGTLAAKFHIKAGGLYSLLVNGNARNGYKYKLLEVVPATSLSILWQLPQIVVMTAAEIMFSVTGLEFSFTQAPRSMKAVLQACWLLSVAIGNMIVVVIAEIKFVESQSSEFMLYASIMLANLLLFLILAHRYKYTDEQTRKCRSTPASTKPVSLSSNWILLKRDIDGQGSYRNQAFSES